MNILLVTTLLTQLSMAQAIQDLSHDKWVQRETATQYFRDGLNSEHPYCYQLSLVLLQLSPDPEVETKAWYLLGEYSYHECNVQLYNIKKNILRYVWNNSLEKFIDNYLNYLNEKYEYDINVVANKISLGAIRIGMPKKLIMRTLYND